MLNYNLNIKKKEYLLPLTLVLIRDRESGGYVAYFDELDNIFAQGETEEDATINLKKLAYTVFKYWKENGHGN